MRQLMHVSAAVCLAAAACGEATVAIGDGELSGAPAMGHDGTTLEQAITSGNVDPGHPSVGMLLGSNGSACSATLVGTRTVLTAAHCLGASSLQLELAGRRYTVSRAVRHPGYGGGNDDDIAVAMLASDVSGVAPSPVHTSAVSIGQTITLVGFGITSEGGSGWGVKRFGTNTISRTSTETFSFGGSSNVCNGDSGGPSFILASGEERVAGVHSTKSGACGSGGTDMRVDAYVSWLREVSGGNVRLAGSSAPPDSPPPPPAATATEGESCASSACAAGLACVPVRNRYGQELGRFCMERCTTTGSSDPTCDGAEVCTASRASGNVCFASGNAATGYTNVESTTTPPPTTPDAPPPPPSDDASCGMNASEQEILSLLNAARSARGLAAVTCDANAMRAALAHSQDMCDNDYFSHDSLDGKNASDRLRAAGVSFSAWGENIAAGYSTPRATHDAWMASSGHRANMLGTSWRRVGIGFVSCPGSRRATYWTEDFVN